MVTNHDVPEHSHATVMHLSQELVSRKHCSAKHRRLSTFGYFRYRTVGLIWAYCMRLSYQRNIHGPQVMNPAEAGVKCADKHSCFPQSMF